MTTRSTTTQHPHSSRTSTTTLFIRNMVCNRCVKVVGQELTGLGLDVRSISLGEAVVAGNVNVVILQNIKTSLERNGFELIEDRRAQTIERIKLAVLKLVRGDELERSSRSKFSAYIARELGQEYQGLSSLFSSVESMTIEQYVILQKIERAKELLKYGELTLSEISFTLGYSSVAHLSSQFKKVTGLTPSAFKKLTQNTRTPLDKIAPPSR
jgi:AraC family transcriptional regulator